MLTFSQLARSIMTRLWSRLPVQHRLGNRSRLGLEALEERALMAAPPTIVGIVGGNTLSANAALQLGIDGADVDGDPLRVSVTVKNTSPGLLLDTFVHQSRSSLNPNGNRFALMHYVNSTDNSVIGSVLVQLFESRGALSAERFVLLSTRSVIPGPGGGPAVQNFPTAALPAFYTDVPVHRVADLTGIGGFIIQSGDATNRNGTGNSPLPNILDQFDPFLGFNGVGVLATANTGQPNSANSQWFITAGATQHLNQRHEIFGQVVSGMDVVNQIVTLGNNGSILQKVEIINSPQDGVVSVRSLDGTGGTATLTITLTDPTGRRVSQDVNITVLGANLPSTVDLGTSTTTAFDPLLEGLSNQVVTVTPSLPVDLVGASTSYDTNTGLITVNAPANFFGSFSVNVLIERADGYQATKQFQITRENFNDYQVGSAAPNLTGSQGLASRQVGNRLYVAAGNAGLEVYDLSNPGFPRLLGRFNTPGFVRDVRIIGNMAYLADSANGLVSVDISNPLNMKLLGTLAMPSEIDEGASSPTPGLAMSLVIEGNLAYVAAFHGGVNIINIANPRAMRIVRHIKFLGPPETDRERIKRAVSLVKVGRYLFVSDNLRGLMAFDTLDFNSEDSGLTGFVAGAFWGLDRVGNRIFAVDTSSGNSALRVFGSIPNIFSATIPILGSLAIGDSPAQVSVSPDGKVAAVGTQLGYTFVSVGNAASMSIVSKVDGVTAPASSFLGGGGVASFGPGNRIALPQVAGPTLIIAPTFSGSQTFVDHNRVRVTVTITNGLVRVIRDTTGRITSIDVLQANGNSTLRITTVGGATTIGDLRVGDPASPNNPVSIGVIAAGMVNISGSVQITGSVRSLTLGHILGGGAVNIGARAMGDTMAATSSVVVLGNVANTNLTSATPLSTLRVRQWIDNDVNPDVITAPGITTALVSAGIFQADLALSGAGITTGNALGNTNINGALNGATWAISGAISTVVVTGVIEGWTLTGSITRIAGLFVRNVIDASVTTTGGISTIVAHQWTSGAIAARSINSLAIRGNTLASRGQIVPGNFGADITLNGAASGNTLGSTTIRGVASGEWVVQGRAANITVGSTSLTYNATFAGDVLGFATGGNFSGSLTAGAIATIRIGENMEQGTLNFSNPVNPLAPTQRNVANLTVMGQMVNSAIKSQGHVGAISVGTMIDSQLLVGIQDGVTGLPTLGDFNTPQANIGSVMVRGMGIVGPSQPAAFVRSVIAGGRIGTVNLTNIIPNNNGALFGVVARSISTYIRRQFGVVQRTAANVTTPLVIESSTTNPALVDYVAQVV